MLFLCVHNAGRSQMAAALLNHHAQGRVYVRSAGSDDKDIDTVRRIRDDLDARVRVLLRELTQPTPTAPELAALTSASPR